MPSIVLYGPSEAPFTIKVQGALTLKKLEFTHRVPSGPEDYRRWNPETGLLPVIEVDGERVHDSGRILDFLDERFPEPSLVSADAKAASAQRRMEQWAEATFVFYWMNYLRALVEREEAAESEGGGVLQAHRRRLRRVVSPRPGLGAEFEQRLDDLVNFLGGRPFFHADQISRADLAVYALLLNIPDTAGEGVKAGIDARPALRQHLDRVDQVIHGKAS